MYKLDTVSIISVYPPKDYQFGIDDIVSLCCSELQCVAVSYSVFHALQRIAACCSMLQHVAVCVAASCSVLQSVEACCSVLQRVAACCSVLQRVVCPSHRQRLSVWSPR